jgi:three-Cys-motif partner protein
MVEHRFGGSWTERKLEALREYLVQYQLIFTRNPNARKLRTIYVDAFAGTGEREGGVREVEPGLFGYDEEVRGYQEGSAYKALSIDHKFHEYVFIEHESRRAGGLRHMLQSKFPQLAGADRLLPHRTLSTESYTSRPSCRRARTSNGPR